MSGQNETNKKHITNSEIDNALAEGRSKNMTGIVIMIVGVVVVLASFSVGGFGQVIVMMAGFLAMGFGNMMRSRARAHVKNEAGVHVIREALDEVFDDVTYEANKSLNLPGLYETPMGFPFKFNRVLSDDYIEASYKGLRIKISDIHLILVTTSYDQDGDEKTHEKTVFKGPWMVCDFGKQLKADMIIAEGGRLKNSVKTDNDRFNRKFSISSSSPHDVFYILTPHVMEYIMEMDQNAQGNTYMNFSRDGRMILAINTGHSMFEMNNLNTSADAMRQKLVSEVRYLTGLLDELSKVDTLYSE